MGLIELDTRIDVATGKPDTTLAWPEGNAPAIERDLDNLDYFIPFGNNRYCGPAALAYLLRTDPDAAAALLRWVSGKRAIRGMARGYMLAALREYGMVPSLLDVKPAITLRRWLDEVQPSVTEAEYLVIITGHYLVVHGDRWFDNRCHYGKPHARSPYLRRRVQRAWRISQASS